MTKKAKNSAFIGRSMNFERHPVVGAYWGILAEGGYVIDTFHWLGLSRLFSQRSTRRYDVVVANDPFAFLVGLLFLKAEHRLFLSLEMFEFQLPNDSVYRIARNLGFKVAHYLALMLADTIVFCNELRRDHYKKRLRIGPKSHVVRNFPSERLFYKAGGQIDGQFVGRFLAYTSSYRVVFVYAGTMAPGRELQRILSAFPVSEVACLCLFGQIVGQMSIPIQTNIHYFGATDTATLRRILSHSTYGLMTYDNRLLNTKYCEPLKLYEYAALGLPVVCNDNFSMMSNELVSYTFSSRDDFKVLVDRLSNSNKILDVAAFDKTIEAEIRSVPALLEALS